MLVFSVSLIRLIYDMIHKDVNPALQIVSAWMVLSVGLVDATVYVRQFPTRKIKKLTRFPRAWPSLWSNARSGVKWAIDYDRNVAAYHRVTRCPC